MTADVLEKQLISDRRFFHSIAEPGWLEFRTSLEIAARLLSLGWSVHMGKDLHTEERLALPTAQFKVNYWSNCGVNPGELANIFKLIQKRTSRDTGKTDKCIDSKQVELDHIKADRTEDDQAQARNHATQEAIADGVLDEILNSYTGVVADWDTGQAGPYLLFRFDIDALALAESLADNHRPAREGFAQKNGQACHACAHDGHIALGLTLASIIAHSTKMKGRVRLVFQPAEESSRGAYSMVKKGLADGVDYMFGCHLGLGLPSGKLGLATRGFLASQKFLLDIQGQAAHAASAPETGKNALLAAASLALNLHSLTQYGHAKAFLNVGRLEAGTLPNVIPDHSQMEFEIRATDADTLEDLKAKMETMVAGNCQARDLCFQLRREGYAEALDSIYLNSYLKIGEKLSLSLKSLGYTLGYTIIVGPDFDASDDVVTWMNQVLRQGGQAMHLMLGTDTTTAHHHPAFDFKEEDLLPALQALIACARAQTGIAL